MSGEQLSRKEQRLNLFLLVLSDVTRLENIDEGNFCITGDLQHLCGFLEKGNKDLSADVRLSHSGSVEEH